MAKSALLKSSIAKKYWMAFTGLFLCLFLVGHLLGNLQLLAGKSTEAALQFNKYAYFMTTNPAVKLLSYLTYFSIIFHAVDGLMLAIQNKKARPVGYAMNNPKNSSSLASRNMAVLGTMILIFIVTHMANFWAKMKFGEMPLQTIEVEQMGQKMQFVIGTQPGQFFPIDKMALTQQGMELKNGKDFYNTVAKIKIGEGYKDLHKITYDFFKDPKFGLIATILYVLSMVVLAFHLWHGFQSAFQSLGVNNKFTPAIKAFGKGFSIIVPLLFAIIPVFIHFVK